MASEMNQVSPGVTAVQAVQRRQPGPLDPMCPVKLWSKKLPGGAEPWNPPHHEDVVHVHLIQLRLGQGVTALKAASGMDEQMVEEMEDLPKPRAVEILESMNQ